MYCVKPVALAAMTVLTSAFVAGCSVSQAPVTLGLAGADNQIPTDDTVFAPPARGKSGRLPPVRKGSKSKRYAGLPDRAPKGSFERAPDGSFDDSNYVKTALNASYAMKQINKYRASKRLKPLTLDPKLTRAAKNHSRDLSRFDRISHYGSDGSSPWERVARTGYNARVAAENVGTGQSSFDEVLLGWKKSPGHNRNLLLADASQMGIALVHDKSTEFKTFWTLVLGTPMKR